MSLYNILAPAMRNPRSYQAYHSVVAELVRQQKTSGPEQSEERIAYTKLNLQRMKRVEKQFVLLPELEMLLQENKPEWEWVVLSESWCGDGAQQIPAIAAIAAQAPGISLRVLLRDENPNWMDTCLTNGSRAIPKLICTSPVTGERMFTWGPRPAAIQEQLNNFKAANPRAEAAEVALYLHSLYAQDRSQALQQDLLVLMRRALQVKENEALAH
ncbi:thioredoxin family protein [Pontibacter akesuensis]|uniref:Thioredoxin n=1 Tax=Pontibacter akesuensis TaxID=388950 RepID=A0A1I7GFE2_9BACT|nr:thioredoxin family protein [Pontibacter akesuensis]GHA57090.1 thioredoxin [Pontibacter akesuensis]SFU47174.1 Thioredoxin [Pontibacter akesuensis]